MRSTGNDIVALGAINKARTNQIQFYSKILSVSEQALYTQLDLPDLPFENFVWLLWSVKESVYKYQQRITPDLIFAPSKIIIQQIAPPFEWGMEEADAFYKGKVLYGSDILYFRSRVSDALIASVISDQESFEHTRWGVQLIDDPGNDRQSSENDQQTLWNDQQSLWHDHQSVAVRNLVLQKLSAICAMTTDEGHPIHCSGDDLRIGKSSAGYPVVLNGEEEVDIPVSLAHHDRYVAYSFVLPPY